MIEALYISGFAPVPLYMLLDSCTKLVKGVSVDYHNHPHACLYECMGVIKKINDSGMYESAGEYAAKYHSALEDYQHQIVGRQDLIALFQEGLAKYSNMNSSVHIDDMIEPASLMLTFELVPFDDFIKCYCVGESHDPGYYAVVSASTDHDVKCISMKHVDQNGHTTTFVFDQDGYGTNLNIKDSTMSLPAIIEFMKMSHLFLQKMDEVGCHINKLHNMNIMRKAQEVAA